MNTQAGIAAAWRTPLVALLVAVGAYIALFWPTLASMIDTWMESSTYSHGVLVIPASLFLIWRARRELIPVRPAPSVAGLVCFSASLLLWLAAHLGAIQVGEQFAFVLGLIAIAWSLLGTAAVWAILFPLAFMFFAVPFGEFAIPTLMEFTAWFTVLALKVTGIPVYQDGFLLSIPSGDFEVAKACSGIRYLIASLSLGTLFAYLTYYSNIRRLLFVAICIVLPILANGLRAYGIVMLAHLSEMKLAVGVDHLIYGWLFFGIVMFFAFVVGSWFRDAPPEGEQASREPFSGAPASRAAVATAAVAVVALAVVPRWLVTGNQGTVADQPEPALPVAVSGWRGPETRAGYYVPAYVDVDATAAGRYIAADGQVDLLIQAYVQPDHELINGLNLIADGNSVIAVSAAEIELAGADGAWQVRRTSIAWPRGRHLVYHWYQIGDLRTTSTIRAKIAEALARLKATPGPRMLVSVTVEDEDREAEHDRLVEAFLADHGQRIVECVVAPSREGCRSPSP